MYVSKLSGVRVRYASAHHFYLHHGLVAIIEQVTRLALINSDNTKQKLTRKTESHWRLIRRDDSFDAVCDIGLQDVILGEFALKVGRKPDPGQGPGFLQKGF